MDIMPKGVIPLFDDALGSAPTGPECEVTWITDRMPDPFRPRAVPLGAREAAMVLEAWSLFDMDGEPAGETGPAHRVRVEADRRVHVIDAATGRRLHLVGEIRLVGRVWRFALATRGNGFRAALNSVMARRLAQLDGVPMSGPRTAETLSAEISSLLGYDAHN